MKYSYDFISVFLSYFCELIDQSYNKYSPLVIYSSLEFPPVDYISYYTPTISIIGSLVFTFERIFVFLYNCFLSFDLSGASLSENFVCLYVRHPVSTVISSTLKSNRLFRFGLRYFSILSKSFQVYFPICFCIVS